jgi:hypothetical protein
MAVTLEPSPQGDADFTLGTHAARNLNIVTGSFDYGATAGGGVSMDIPLHNVLGCLVGPAYGYVFRYSSGTLEAFYVGALDATGGTVTVAEVMTKVATGTAMSTCTALTFFAWGYN